ncbi:Bacterial membrane flanked domain protein [Rosistilla ulvae]|uniref:Bacterial membrane flanked domain protein n=1 Tax=Rosistilla ulvae TaxID=1930277 RepID=A0A517M1T0_9BACT|nr:PH domain-containing protein [Rosistilla ulvae]QDS88834.1 Bacterial membrane flanked domain protein [Rosistilla ulvae]
MTESPPPPQPFDASKITRPDDSLLVYYLLVAACTVVGFPFVFLPLWIRFKTLRYRFDDTGVSMCWGYFFRREVHLTYRRLQDIHVTRNIVERWMGLSKLPLQTASGTAGATMQIEGIRAPEPLRDFLYAQMRGARNETLDSESDDGEDDVLGVLTEIRNELRRIRNEPAGDET